MSTLFISHSSRDAAAAEKLKARLEERGHHSVFLDLDPEKGIRAGAGWERTLYTKLRSCRAVVALCTDHYLDSRWCFAEIALARMEGKDIFALQAEPWGETTKMPPILGAGQYVDLRQGEDEGYQRLWRGLEARGITPEQHRVWRPEDPPYPGLRAFDERDAPVFFGRGREVRDGVELLNRVRRQGHPRMVMVLGASGSGKSSLARAGLVPELRRDAGEWIVVGPLRPGRRPLRELAAALAAAFEAAGESRSWEELHRRLAAAPQAGAGSQGGAAESEEAEAARISARARLRTALDELETELTAADEKVVNSVASLKAYLDASRGSRPALGPVLPATGQPLVELAAELRLGYGPSAASVLLVIDQLEELLGHDRDGAGHPANRFLGALRAAVEADDSPLLVLATLRSDYLGTLQRSSHLRGVGFKSLSVGPMSREGMLQVIEAPARLGQIELGDGLADLLLHDTGTADALPLLAFTLRVMWDRCRHDRLLEIREYRRLGGLQGAIAQVAGETFEAALELGDEPALRDAFLRLARPTEEGSGWARQPASWDELDEPARPMLQLFVGQRLLVRRENGAVEVAHEALFRSWETLRGWLSTNAEGLHLLRDIHLDAGKWRRAATDEEKEPYLWRGGRLARALELRDGGVLTLRGLDLEFVEAADVAERARIEAETARQRRELRRTRAFSAVIAVALVVVVLGYLKIRRQARHTLSRQLAAQSVQLSGSQLDLALLLALAAGRVEPTVDARQALLAGVQRHPRLERYLHGPGDPIRGVALSGDGATLAAVSEGADGAVLLWRLSAGRPAPSSALPLPETRDPVVAVDASGRWLAAGGVDRRNFAAGRLSVWDLAADPPARRHAPDPGGLVSDLAFCGLPDPVLAWIAGDRVFLWRPAGEGAALPATGGGVAVRRLAFSADCGCLAIGYEESGNVDLLALGGAPGARVEPPRTLCAPRRLKGPKSTDRMLAAGVQGVVGLTFGPAGETLAAARVDGSIDVWDLRADRHQALRPSAGPAAAVAFSPRGALASSGRDGTVVLWDLGGAQPVAERLPGHAGGVLGLAFDSGGARLASGGEDGKAILWRLDARQRLARRLGGHSDQVLSVAFSPGGERLASAGVDETVKLWDLADGTWSDLAGSTGETPALAWSADATRVATGALDGSLHLWHIGEGRAKHWHTPGRRPVGGVAFSPDGETLASAVDREIVLFDLGAEAAAGEPAASPLASHPADVWSLLYADAGRSLVASDVSGPVLEWDVATGEPRHARATGKDSEPVLTAIALSPGDVFLAAAGSDRCVYLWRRSGDGPPECLAGHRMSVLAVAFDRRGETLFSADAGGDLMVWDLASRQQIGRLERGHRRGEPINSLAASPLGTLASAGDDHAVVLWELDWRAVACDVAGRELSRDEWRKYLGDTPRRDLCAPPGR